MNMLLTWLGFTTITREEAAREILEREIRFIYRPTIIEVEDPTKRDRQAGCSPLDNQAVR